MATIKQGARSILFFRDFSKRSVENGARLRYQVEHSVDFGKSIENLITKDGSEVVVNEGENTISVTSYAYDEDDGGVALWKELRTLYKNSKEVEIWEVDLDSVDEAGNADATYFRGFFGSVSEPKPAEGAIELSFEYTMKGQGVEGKETLSEAQLEVIDRATSYEYNTIKAEGEE